MRNKIVLFLSQVFLLFTNLFHGLFVSDVNAQSFDIHHRPSGFAPPPYEPDYLFTAKRVVLIVVLPLVLIISLIVFIRKRKKKGKKK